MTALQKALQRTSQGHRERRRPENTWKRDSDKDTWTAGFNYSQQKMEAAGRTELDGQKSSVASGSLGLTRHKSSKSDRSVYVADKAQSKTLL